MSFTGFETIGNATVIAYDQGRAIITTDPWIQGSAYFGSWSLSHEVPTEQRKNILSSDYIWFSHGHPDHLNPDSMNEFLGKKILLPDHVNGRIKKDLESMGHKVQVLPHKEWVQLSPKVKILCVSDYFQDAVLLIDVNGRLLVDTNDAIDRGWGQFVRKTIKNYKVSVLLSLFGYGDADMIHFFDENGNFMEPKAAKKNLVGKTISAVVDSYGVTHCVAFSSMHHYQRTDSIWANKYTTPLTDYKIGYQSNRCELLPAFIHFDCETDQWSEIKPKSNDQLILTPLHFGDHWDDVLDDAEFKKLHHYFHKIDHLHTFLDFINFKVGNKDYTIGLSQKKQGRGLTFEVPRHSLMTAVEYQIFDDLLIGNFMKTKLHGNWSASKLYPDFTPYVARYSDNAYVTTASQLEIYMEEYKKRDPMEYILHSLEQKSINFFRKNVAEGSPIYEGGKKTYWFVKGLRGK